ncbi:hypothetical protein [Bradyrhizobium tunisiense]|uniref:hypothetical protein n=1 Tax=Bradyrhizobium tunisiense TaxID=3278709 RepID=UPI0035DA4159
MLALGFILQRVSGITEPLEVGRGEHGMHRLFAESHDVEKEGRAALRQVNELGRHINAFVSFHRARRHQPPPR